MSTWICPRCQDLEDIDVSMDPKELIKYPKDRRKKCWIMECPNCEFYIFTTKDQEYKLPS